MLIARIVGRVQCDSERRFERCSGTKAIWNGSSTATKSTTTDIAATPDWPASPRLNEVVLLPIQSQTLTHTAGENTATASFKTRPPLEWHFSLHLFGWHSPFNITSMTPPLAAGLDPFGRAC